MLISVNCSIDLSIILSVDRSIDRSKIQNYLIPDKTTKYDVLGNNKGNLSNCHHEKNNVDRGVHVLFYEMFYMYIQTLIRCQSESMVNCTRIHSAQSIFFWNITRRQAVSPVAKFHHVLGRCFIIQRVILIFIKCLSVNQNQLFYMKV